MHKRTGSFLHLLGLTLVFLGVTAVLYGDLRTLPRCPLSSYDEGVILVEAQRMRAGQLPYRDYDAVYGPLEPAIQAWVGPGVSGLRLLRAAALGALAVLGVFCVRRLGAGSLALLPAAAVVGCASNLVHPALALVVGVGPLLARGLARDAPRAWLAVAGAGVGAAALARLDFGALAGCAATGTLAVHCWQRRESPRQLLARLAPVAAGAAPGVGIYVALVAIAPGRFAAGWWAMGAVRGHLILPYPLPPPADAEGWWLQLGYFLLPPVACVVGGAVLGRRLTLSRRPGAWPLDPLTTYLGLILAGLFLYGLNRADHPHLFPAFVVGGVLLLGLAAPWVRRGAPDTRRALKLASVSLLALTALLRLDATIEARQAGQGLARLETPVLEGLLGDAQLDTFYRSVRESVEELDPSRGPIFVGLGRTLPSGAVEPDHSRVNHSDALIYAILGRPVAVRQHCMVPGWTTTVAKQRELIAELEQRRPQVVLLALDLFQRETNASQLPGATLLDDYLQSTFTTRWGLGRYAFLSRTPAGR